MLPGLLMDVQQQWQRVHRCSKPSPKPTPTPSPSPSPSPTETCDGLKPDYSTYACYYHGCAEYVEGSKDCKVCCEGCQLQTDSIKVPSAWRQSRCSCEYM